MLITHQFSNSSSGIGTCRRCHHAAATICRIRFPHPTLRTFRLIVPRLGTYDQCSTFREYLRHPALARRPAPARRRKTLSERCCLAANLPRRNSRPAGAIGSAPTALPPNSSTANWLPRPNGNNPAARKEASVLTVDRNGLLGVSHVLIRHTGGTRMGSHRGSAGRTDKRSLNTSALCAHR